MKFLRRLFRRPPSRFTPLPEPAGASIIADRFQGLWRTQVSYPTAWGYVYYSEFWQPSASWIRYDFPITDRLKVDQ